MFSATAIWWAAVSRASRSASSAPRSAAANSSSAIEKSARSSAKGSTRRWRAVTPVHGATSTVLGRTQRNPCGILPRRRGGPEQQLEVHGEVLELLPLSVRHDRACLGIRLDGDALLVPADRLGLFGERRAQPRKRPRGGGQLLRR